MQNHFLKGAAGSEGRVAKRSSVRGALIGRFAIAIAAMFAGVGQAQEALPRVIRIVHSNSSGSAADAFTRIVAEALGRKLDRAVIVEPRPGAGGNISADFVAKAPADGSVLLMGSVASLAIQATYAKSLSYDFERELAPISKVAESKLGAFVGASTPIKSLSELTASARANPGKLTCASAGTGGLLHLTCELYKKAAGVDLLHVPYRGTAFFLPSLMAGDVSVAFDTFPAYLSLMKAGKVRAIAVASTQRTAVSPDTPTSAEAGLPGLVSTAVYGLYAPAKTPRGVIALIAREMEGVMRDEGVREKFLQLGVEPEASSPAALGILTHDEIRKWAAIMKTANIREE